MPSPSLMPKGEFVSGFPERDSPIHPANVNGVSVILFDPILETETKMQVRQSLSSWLRKQGRH